jgi:ABC-2 type transport system permease protein
MSDERRVDVIHDIGFRHYDGPRLGRGWIFRSLLVETLRGMFGIGRSSKSKVMPYILIGFIVVIALVSAIILIIAGSDALDLTYVGFPLVGGVPFLLSLYLAGRAPDAVSRDLREGVMPLYFSRPLKRSDYVFAKLAGLAIGFFAIIATSQTIMLIGALLAKLPVGTHLWNWMGGLVVAALLSVFLASIGAMMAAMSTKRGIAAASVMSIFIVLGSVSGITMSMAAENGNDTLATYLIALDPYGLIDLLFSSWFGVAAQNTFAVDVGGTGTLAFTAAYLTIVGACVAGLLHRYRKVGGV